MAHKLPEEKIFMSIQEFIAMMSKAGFIKDVFTDRDVAVSYNLAKMTEIENANYDKHIKLYFIEFLELQHTVRNNVTSSSKFSWRRVAFGIKKRSNIGPKDENMLPSLLKIWKEFIERYKFPVRDPETGLLVMASPSKLTGLVGQIF